MIKHPLQPGMSVFYDGRRTGCKKALHLREGTIKKHTEVDGEYWYLLQNGKVCHQDKIIKRRTK